MIEEQKTYKFDGRVFNSLQEAQDYEAAKNKEKEIFQHNVKLLEADSRKFIPVLQFDKMHEGETDIFWWDEIDRSWNTLTRGYQLRYFEEKIQILSNEQFFERLFDLTWHIEAGEFNRCIVAILEMAEGCDVDYKRILESLAEIHVEPQIEYL